MQSDDTELRAAAALAAEQFMAERLQPGEFPIPETRSAKMAANFLYILVARQGGSITIPAKMWSSIIHPDVKVHLSADKNGNVTARIDRQSEQRTITKRAKRGKRR